MTKDHKHYDEDFPLDCGHGRLPIDQDLADYGDPFAVRFPDSDGYPETHPDGPPLPRPDEWPAFSLRAFLRSLWGRITFRCPDDLVTRV